MSEQPTTDRVSDERLAEILAWYVNWQPCAEDPGLSRMEADAISLFRELQRLRSPGGASALHAAASDLQQILSKLIDAGEIEITATDIGAEALCTRLNALKHALSNHGD